MKTKKQQFKVGDKVQVYRSSEWQGWVSLMDQALDGRVLTISNIPPPVDGVELVQFKEFYTPSGYHWKFPISCIKKIPKPNKQPIKVGDKVRVYRKLKWFGWTDQMDEVLDGRVLIISMIHKHPEFKYVRFNDYPYGFPFSCIKRA